MLQPADDVVGGFLQVLGGPDPVRLPLGSQALLGHLLQPEHDLGDQRRLVHHHLVQSPVLLLQQLGPRLKLAERRALVAQQLAQRGQLLLLHRRQLRVPAAAVARGRGSLPAACGLVLQGQVLVLAGPQHLVLGPQVGVALVQLQQLVLDAQDVVLQLHQVPGLLLLAQLLRQELVLQPHHQHLQGLKLGRLLRRLLLEQGFYLEQLLFGQSGVFWGVGVFCAVAPFPRVFDVLLVFVVSF